jgi:hypothetical protein
MAHRRSAEPGAQGGASRQISNGKDCGNRAVFCVLRFTGRDGCGTSSNGLAGQTIGEIATNIVRLAEEGKVRPFASVMEENQRQQLVGMIRRSGMLTNYANRLQESRNEGRLDYHEIPQNLHFQIDSKRDGRTWKVTRIWLCR